MTKRTKGTDRPHDLVETAEPTTGADVSRRQIAWLDGLPTAGGTAARAIDIVELAHDIATIASRTSDAETGRRLMAVVERMLQAAGLPPA